MASFTRADITRGEELPNPLREQPARSRLRTSITSFGALSLWPSALENPSLGEAICSFSAPHVTYWLPCGAATNCPSDERIRNPLREALA